jgi:hypothetical protein
MLESCSHRYLYSMFNISIMYVTKLPGRQLIYFGPSVWNSGFWINISFNSVKGRERHKPRHPTCFWWGRKVFWSFYVHVTRNEKYGKAVFNLCLPFPISVIDSLKCFWHLIIVKYEYVLRQFDIIFHLNFKKFFRWFFPPSFFISIELKATES